jgi:hypothetical protein
MRSISIRPALLAALLALLTVFVPTSTLQAAPPGQLLVNSTGTVPANGSRQVAFFDTGPANVLMRVDAPPSASSLTFTIRAAATVVASWSVRAGETTWGYLDVPANAQLEITNATPAALNYTFKAYARSVLPAIGEDIQNWSGVSAGVGTQSSAQFDVATPGLYSFAMSASSGSFQISVNDTYLLKTVAQGVALDPADSTFYLPAGTHTFKIIQNAGAAQTDWVVTFGSVGGVNTLPFTENTGVLGGGFFSEEWIPLQVEADQPVNLRVAVTGAVGNSLTVELRNGATSLFTTSSVFGGEVFWIPGQLAAGANALHIVTNNANSAPLAYSISVDAVASAPSTWAGTSYGIPAHPTAGNSSIKLSFPSDGLYRFRLSAASGGRFQLLVGDQYLRKTVDASGVAEFTAFVPAGSQTLALIQDPGAASTSWSVEVGAAEAPADTLPFTRASSAFGAGSDTFKEEWLPIQSAGNTLVNLRIVVNGAAGDSVQVELYNQATQAFSATTVYGGEVLWSTSQLGSGSNRLHVVANNANAGAISYLIDVQPIPTTPYVWDGIAHGNGLDSTITVQAPASGVYTLTLTISEGAGLVKIDQGTQRAQTRQVSPAASSSIIRVPLTAGLHTITFEQDAAEPRTVWSIDLRSRSQDPIRVMLPLVVN